MRISDWSSDVCSSDLDRARVEAGDVDMFDGRRQQLGLAHVVGGGVGVRNGHFSFSPLPQAGGEPNTARYSVTTFDATRSDERRVGKECVSTCRSRWSPYT